MKSILNGTAILAVLAAPAMAQDAFVLDDIVFSAGLTPLQEGRTGVTVEVVTEDELAEAGDIQLSDYLATLPGLTIAQNGPTGTSTSIRVRGLDGRYVPVLVNGINITDPSSTQTSLNFGTLTVGGISRIEVLYGSQSAIYGSEAIAGVISITTVEPPDDLGTDITVALEAGSYETFYGSIGIGTRFERGTLNFSASRTVTEGFSAAEENDGNTEADGFNDTTLTFGGTFDVTETVTLGADLFYQDSFSEFDAGAGPGGDDPDRYLESERHGARAFARIEGGVIDHELSYVFSETTRYDPGGLTSDFNGERQELRYLGTAELGASGTLTVGLENVAEDILTTSTAGSIETNAIFTDYFTALSDDLDLAASLRYEDHSRFGGQATGRLALAWRPDIDTVVRASVGTGFRAPSLFELFSSFGDPNLQPEESLSFEIGVERAFAWGELGATAFYTEIDDLIDFDGGATACGSGFGCYNQVPGTTVSQGIELAGTYDFTGQWTAYGNYTYTDARTDGARLPRVPRHHGVLGLRGDITDEISLDMRAQAAVDTEVSGFASNPLDDYVVFDTSVGYAVNDSTELYLRVNNVFDEEYQTAPGYGTSDRAFYIGLRARF